MEFILQGKAVAGNYAKTSREKKNQIIAFNS